MDFSAVVTYFVGFGLSHVWLSVLFIISILLITALFTFYPTKKALINLLILAGPPMAYSLFKLAVYLFYKLYQPGIPRDYTLALELLFSLWAVYIFSLVLSLEIKDMNKKKVSITKYGIVIAFVFGYIGGLLREVIYFYPKFSDAPIIMLWPYILGITTLIALFIAGMHFMAILLAETCKKVESGRIGGRMEST